MTTMSSGSTATDPPKRTPCIDAGASVTYDTQSTCLFRTKEGSLVYMGDRWSMSDLADSRYVWLPAEFSDGKLKIRWEGSWKPE